MNDADIEMAELAEIGNAYYFARKAGVCPHASTQRLRCTDICGRQFNSSEEWFEATEEVISEWL